MKIEEYIKMKVVGLQWPVDCGLRRFVCVSLVFIFHFSFIISASAQAGLPVQRHTVNFESRNGESFTVFMDGNAVNRMPQGYVMVNDVSSQTHEVIVALKYPEQKAAVLQLLPGEPVVTVYVDYDSRLDRLSLYTPSYNLAQTVRGVQGVQGVRGAQEVQGSAGANEELTVPDTLGGVRPATEEDLAAMMLRMKNQTFDSDRLALGKVIVASSRLTAEQIGRLASMLDYSASQVELLKYAYSYCADPQNYYKAIDILTFNSDKRKVMDYIATQ